MTLPARCCHGARRPCHRLLPHKKAKGVVGPTMDVVRRTNNCNQSTNTIMTTTSTVSGMSPSNLAHLMSKMRLQLEAKIEALQGDCASEKNKLKDVFAAAMVKIPRNVKAMRVGEFNALYKCDILSVIESMPESSAGKKRDRFETPSHQTSTVGRVPLQTPSRTVRKGEMLL